MLKYQERQTKTPNVIKLSNKVLRQLKRFWRSFPIIKSLGAATFADYVRARSIQLHSISKIVDADKNCIAVNNLRLTRTNKAYWFGLKAIMPIINLFNWSQVVWCHFNVYPIWPGNIEIRYIEFAIKSNHWVALNY